MTEIWNNGLPAWRLLVAFVRPSLHRGLWSMLNTGGNADAPRQSIRMARLGN